MMNREMENNTPPAPTKQAHAWPLALLRRALGSERGQSMAELAIFLPLLLLILSGVLDFGRVIHSYVVVVNAAREAAVAGAAAQMTNQQLETLMNDELARGGVNNGTPSFTIAYANRGTPAKQVISIDLTYEVPLLILVLPFSTVTVRSHAEMLTFWN